MKLYLVAYVYRGVDLEPHLFLDEETAQKKFEEIEENEYNEEYDSLFIEEIEAPVESPRYLKSELECAYSKICAAKAALGC